MDNISIITAHFFDFAWIKLWAKKIRENTDEKKIKEVLIINQDRTLESRSLLKEIYPKAKILEYPRNEEQILMKGHDHAEVLNNAVKEATGDYICIFDSDCHPFSPEWLPRCEKLFETNDAVLALDRNRQIEFSTSLSHPCFMIFKKESVKLPLSFDKGFPSRIYDTGRLIGKQLENMGNVVVFAEPHVAFSNNYGEIYLDSIYHHGKGSYAGGGIYLQKQRGFRESYFSNIVINKERYELTKFEHIQYKLKFIKDYGLLNYTTYLVKIYSKRIKEIF